MNELLKTQGARALEAARKNLGLVEHWATPSIAAAAAIAVAEAYNAGWFACRNGSEGTNPFMDTEVGG